MSRCSNRMLLAAGIGAATLVAPTLVHASLLNGLVDVWSVGVVAQFDTTSAVFTGSTPQPSVSPTSLSWGTSTGSGQSGLDLLPGIPDPALANTNGAPVADIGVTHRNQPISDDTLLAVDIVSTLTLTPFDPAAIGLPPAPITFHIHFAETPNDADPCADGGAKGAGVNGAGCADIFVIDPSALNFPFFYDLDGPAGPLQNRQYFISFFEQSTGLRALPPLACAATGAGPVCQGFETMESTNTTLRFASLITTERVTLQAPEPGTLALLAAALACAGSGVRRRRS